MTRLFTKSYFMYLVFSRLSGWSAILWLVVLMSGCAKQFNGSYNNDQLVIDSIVPAAGAAGTAVRIYGKGFASLPGNNQVYFNGVAASIDSNAALGMLLVYAPAAGTTGDVSVKTSQDTASGPVFTYTTPAPVITGIVYNGLFAINGQHFDPQAVVKIGGAAVTGFSFSDLGNGQNQLVHQNFTPASSLDNPAPITVTVGIQTSNIYSFLFAPVVNSVTPDTVSERETVVLQGILFGDQTLPSSVKAYYFDQGVTKTYMTPDPVIVSWNINTIQITMPDYGSYPIGDGRTPFYFEVNVGSRSGAAAVSFHID